MPSDSTATTMTTPVRRSRAMPTDGPTAKFLYTIIKQLDLKSIDWTLVASQLEISNGHAARMRYSRFRQQMEGISSMPRASRPKKTPNKSKVESCKGELQRENMAPPPGPEIKREPGLSAFGPSHPYIKADPYGDTIPNLADIPHVSQVMPGLHHSSGPFAQMTVAPSELSRYAPASMFPGPGLAMGNTRSPQHVWAPVKSESEDKEGVDDVLVKVEVPEQGFDCRDKEVKYEMAVPGEGCVVESRE